MDIQKVGAKDKRNQLKIHKLPRDRLTRNCQLQTKYEDYHINYTGPIIDRMISNFRFPQM